MELHPEAKNHIMLFNFVTVPNLGFGSNKSGLGEQ